MVDGVENKCNIFVTLFHVSASPRFIENDHEFSMSYIEFTVKIKKEITQPVGSIYVRWKMCMFSSRYKCITCILYIELYIYYTQIQIYIHSVQIYYKNSTLKVAMLTVAMFWYQRDRKVEWIAFSSTRHSSQFNSVMICHIKMKRTN